MGGFNAYEHETAWISEKLFPGILESEQWRESPLAREFSFALIIGATLLPCVDIPFLWGDNNWPPNQGT